MAKPKSKGRLVLLHWNADECTELAEPLVAAKWHVQAVSTVDDLKMNELRAEPPVALLISLRRLPSHGREVVGAVWSTQWGREIPVIFFDGQPEKVEATRAKFPKAMFAQFDELPTVLEDLPTR